MSHIFRKMAEYDKISPALLERIYRNAKSTKDTATLLTVASRPDLPISMHKSLLALGNPVITGARLKYMDSAALHTLVSGTTNKKVYTHAAECRNLLKSTVTLLLNNGNAAIWEKLLVNSSIAGDLRQNALARYIQSSLTLKGRPLRSATQVILSFPEYTNTMFSTLTRVDPLYTGRLSVMLLEYLPWSSKVGNRAVVDLVSTFSSSLTSLSAATVGESHNGKLVIPTGELQALSKQYGWSTERHYNSDTSVIYVRHALSNISKLLHMGILRIKACQEVTDSLEKSLAFLKDNDNKVPLTSQERTHTLGRLADILAILRTPPRNPKGALAVTARAAKSSSDLDALIDSVGEYTNSLSLVAVLTSPHYKHSSAISSVLATTGVEGNARQCWANVKKAMEYRSPVSPEVLATLCVARQACIPVSLSYIDTLLSAHSDPVATLGATLKLLKNNTLPATVNLVGSRYFDQAFTHDVPLAELPSKIPANVLKVLVDTVDDLTSLDTTWDVLSLTTDFPKVSLKEALESSKLLGR